MSKVRKQKAATETDLFMDYTAKLFRAKALKAITEYKIIKAKIAELRQG